MLIRFLFGFLVLLATGCTGVVVQDDPGPRGRYFYRDLAYATSKGAIETIVAGNPFGVEKVQFDDRVRGLMKYQNRGVPAEFVAGQNDRTDPVYKVVVAFNLPSGFPTADMCKNPTGLPSREPGGELDIAIAFCQGDEVMSDTTGYASNVSSASDPKFAELVRYATQYMVSDYNYENDNQDNKVVP